MIQLPPPPPPSPQEALFLYHLFHTSWSHFLLKGPVSIVPETRAPLGAGLALGGRQASEDSRPSLLVPLWQDRPSPSRSLGRVLTAVWRQCSHWCSFVGSDRIPLPGSPMSLLSAQSDTKGTLPGSEVWGSSVLGWVRVLSYQQELLGDPSIRDHWKCHLTHFTLSTWEPCSGELTSPQVSTEGALNFLCGDSSSWSSIWPH